MLRSQKRFWKKLIKSTVILSVLFITGCANVLQDLIQEEGTGSLSVTIEDDSSSRDLPGLEYRLSGSGPDSKTVALLAITEETVITDMRAGEWTIFIEAVDSNETVQLYGASTVTVLSGEETVIEITLQLASGTGSLLLTLSWDEEFTVSPAVQVTLTGTTGEVVNQIIQPTTDGKVIENLSLLPTGYYQISVQLLDSTEIITGMAKTIKIENGMTEEISIDFPELNKVGERIEITGEEFTITWDTDSEGSTIDYYQIYYRIRGTEEWIFLAEAEQAYEPSLLIHTGLLDYGVYEFAVTSVSYGEESEMHTSMDDDALPITGWYVAWSEQL